MWFYKRSTLNFRNMSLESNSVVDLNVGGLLYTTSVDTLTKVRIIISTMC